MAVNLPCTSLQVVSVCLENPHKCFIESDKTVYLIALPFCDSAGNDLTLKLIADAIPLLFFLSFIIILLIIGEL